MPRITSHGSRRQPTPPNTILRVASRVVDASDREHPADAVLRGVLKGERISARERTEVSETVFAYYRWLQWLDSTKPLLLRLEHAQALARNFETNPGGFSEPQLSERCLPAWVDQELQVTPALARALQRKPRLWLRAKPDMSRAICSELGDSSIFGAAPWASTLEYSGKADLFHTPAFKSGKFEVQDISSQAVGLLCAPKPGETWWDVCAGEGGKTLHLSALMGNKGAVWATDVAHWRLERLKRRAARAGVFNYRTALWKDTNHLPTRTKFDGVLIDAPCSGIGTWHRNPHARWTTTPEDVRRLAELQRTLLDRAAAAVKPGGRLFYSVCTLSRSETLEVVSRFERPDFEPLELTLPGIGVSAQTRHLQLLPQELGGNGMFIAAWKRVATIKS